MSEKAFSEEDTKSSAKGKELSPQRRKEFDQLVKLGGLKLLEEILQQTELDGEEGQKCVDKGQQFDRPAATEKTSGLVDLSRKRGAI